MTSLESFQAQWMLHPSKWAKVKAIAGCSSDNIEGVEGVGNVKAAQFLRGTLKGKIADKIAGSWPMIKRNYGLVKLPFPGTKLVSIGDNEFSQEGWDRMAVKYGMNSLAARGIKKRP